MLNLSFPSNVDSTMLSTFDSCPQKFLQEFLIKKVPVARSIHLHAGGCVASAVEDVRVGYYQEGLTLEQCFEKAFVNYVHNWGDVETPEKEHKDFTNCWGVVEAYFHEYPPGTDYFQPLIQPDGRPAVEFKFAIPMQINNPDTGDPILFSGRIDLLAQPLTQHGQVFALDEKTTKALGSSWQYQWDMRGQFYGYVFALNYLGYNCPGAVVRGMAIQQTQYGFQEKILLISEFQLKRWWEQTHRKVERLIEMYKKAISTYDISSIHQAFDYSFGEACTSYGGCHLKLLCMSEKPWDLYQDWEERIWEPLESDPTKTSKLSFSDMKTVSLKDAMAGLE